MIPVKLEWEKGERASITGELPAVPAVGDHVNVALAPPAAGFKRWEVVRPPIFSTYSETVLVVLGEESAGQPRPAMEEGYREARGVLEAHGAPLGGSLADGVRHILAERDRARADDAERAGTIADIWRLLRDRGARVDLNAELATNAGLTLPEAIALHLEDVARLERREEEHRRHVQTVVEVMDRVGLVPAEGVPAEEWWVQLSSAIGEMVAMRQQVEELHGVRASVDAHVPALAKWPVTDAVEDVLRERARLIERCDALARALDEDREARGRANDVMRELWDALGDHEQMIKVEGLPFAEARSRLVQRVRLVAKRVADLAQDRKSVHAALEEIHDDFRMWRADAAIRRLGEERDDLLSVSEGRRDDMERLRADWQRAIDDARAVVLDEMIDLAKRTSRDVFVSSSQAAKGGYDALLDRRVHERFGGSTRINLASEAEQVRRKVRWAHEKVYGEAGNWRLDLAPQMLDWLAREVDAYGQYDHRSAGAGVAAVSDHGEKPAGDDAGRAAPAPETSDASDAERREEVSADGYARSGRGRVWSGTMTVHTVSPNFAQLMVDMARAQRRFHVKQRHAAEEREMRERHEAERAELEASD